MKTASQICVAGLKQDDREHIRPVTERSHPLTRSLLSVNGGPFQLGARVDLGMLRPHPSPPEIEDHLFLPDRSRLVEVLDPGEYWSLIEKASESDLGSIFGPELVRDGWGMSVPEGEGDASLGCLVVSAADRPSLSVAYDKVSLRMSAPDKPFYFPVTDIRLYEPDHETPRTEAVESVERRLTQGVPLRLMVGLGRAWARNAGEEPRHWLQINGLCLKDKPLGDTP